MARAIRVGVIGANPDRGWAAPTHLPALSALDEFELVAVATSNLDSANAAAQRFGARKAYDDGDELIADGDVDLVVVSVKIPDHYRYVKAAIEHDKHVFCEWPLGRNLEEAAELAALADERGVVHGIGLQGRKSAIVNYVRDLVSDGYIGDALFVSLVLAVRGGGSLEFTPRQAWTADRTNGYTELSILGAHNLDIVRYILGDFTELQAMEHIRSPFGRVEGTDETIPVTSPDVALIEGRLAGGTFLSATVQAGLSHGLGIRLEIAGTDGILVLSDPLTLNFGDATITFEGANGNAEPAPMAVPERYQTVPDAVPATWARNVAALYLGMAGAIEASTPAPSPNFHTAVELHALLDVVRTAAESGVRQILTP